MISSRRQHQIIELQWHFIPDEDMVRFEIGWCDEGGGDLIK